MLSSKERCFTLRGLQRDHSRGSEETGRRETTPEGEEDGIVARSVETGDWGTEKSQVAVNIDNKPPHVIDPVRISARPKLLGKV